MKWWTYWWGAVIQAEDKQEDNMLRELHGKLQNAPISGYEEGTCKLELTEDVKIAPTGFALLEIHR